MAQLSAPGQQHLHGEHHAPLPVARADDPESGARVIGSLAPDRVSLPSRPHSMRSHRTDTVDGDQADGANDNDSAYAWGPKHPCFPHPNPHVPLDSPLYNSTRIIRVSRDWMQKGDLAPTYQNLYPEVLDPYISEDDFRELIKHINDSLIDAFNPLSFRAWLDCIMGVATLWLWDDIGLTQVKRKLAELERWIEKWNAEYGAKEGVRIIPLRRTGYMNLDIQVPDPQFVVVPVSEPPTHDGQQDIHSALSQEPPDTYPHTPISPGLRGGGAGSPFNSDARS